MMNSAFVVQCVRDHAIGEESMALEDRQHLDGLGSNAVDDPVRAPEHLADVVTVGVLGHDSPVRGISVARSRSATRRSTQRIAAVGLSAAM